MNVNGPGADTLFLTVRAIYFCTYSTVKNFCNETFSSPDTPPVHICSAAAAGIVSSTLTNPVSTQQSRDCVA